MWYEPWQDSVIINSKYFVLAKVTSVDQSKGVTISIIKSLAGQKLQGEIQITNFSMLDLVSFSHADHFDIDSAKEYYFFIAKNKNEEYCIATPTSGFAKVKDEKVIAIYRHSFHGALVPADVYEKTMTAIFNNYHNLPYDKQYVNDYINKYISLKPAGFEEGEIDTFFAQHVALECIYHLRLSGFYSQILPFLNDVSNFHNEVSAARALATYNTPECKQELLNVISNKKRDRFVQVMCIWTLSEFKPVELKAQLQKIGKKASTDNVGFDSNIMDPRIPFLPSVKGALNKLISLL